MQDPNPMPWGTQDRFQAHFIVRKNANHLDLTVRTVLKTKGYFSSKRVVNVSWNGGKLADVLNNDAELNEMIIKQNPDDATIYVEPTDDVVRIHGKWKDHFNFKISKEMFEIYDRIAGHIKAL